MTPDQIMIDFARDGIFPEAAMRAATENREIMTPIFLDLVTRLATHPVEEQSDAEGWQLAPVIHLLAQWREAAAYQPLVKMMRCNPHDLEHLLGDTVTESADRILASVFNGDLDLLFEAIEHPDTYDFSRSSMFRALVLIIRLQPDLRPKAETFIRGFRDRNPDVSEVVLWGWANSIAFLGLEDMTEQVRATFDRGEISWMMSRFEHFLEDLSETLNNDGHMIGGKNEAVPIESAIDEMSWWHCYSEEYHAEKRSQTVQNVLNMAPQKPLLDDPWTKVGRNDPCPCGSGKKFKKCCLH